MEIVHEEWRPVCGQFSGWRYEVSSFGRVQSVDSERSEKTKSGAMTVRRRCGRMLNQRNRNGYLAVNLSDPSRATKVAYGVHRLVAEAFIQNPDSLPEVNHKDTCKTNNHLDNLEWSTRKGNAEHALRNGCYRCGERATQSKLTDAQAVQAYEMRKRGVALQDIGKVFDVHYTTIQLIAAGKHFKHLGLSPLPFTRRATANTNKD
jgi:formate dehydrogenase assembly factor FdhD